MSVRLTGESEYSYEPADYREAISNSITGDGLRHLAREGGDIYGRTHFKDSVAKGFDDFTRHATEGAGWAALGVSATCVGAGAARAFAGMSGAEKTAVAAGAAICYN